MLFKKHRNPFLTSSPLTPSNARLILTWPKKIGLSTPGKTRMTGFREIFGRHASSHEESLLPKTIFAHPCKQASNRINVRGGPVCSVAASGWFCESPVGLGKWRMWKRCFFKQKRISTINRFEEEGFYLDKLWNRRISSALIHLGVGYHLVLGF